MNNQLPKDWKWVKLGEACDIIMGQSPPSTSYNTDGIGLPFFQGKAEFTELHPLVEKWCNAPKKIAESNDILLSVRAPVGTTNLANQKCCIGRGLAAIRFENYKYAFYFLRSRQQELDSKGTGTTFRAISGETIRETLFPLPPKPTQLAIVSKIEELFSEIENGIKSLLTALQQLKTYRQSVLKWAFEGKLTNSLNYDSNDLHENYDLNIAAEPEVKYKTKKNHSNQNNQINHSSVKRELPEGWKWVESGEFFDFVTSGSRGWAKYYSEAGAIFIRITNLDFDSLELDLEDRKIQYVNPPSTSEGIRTKVEEGDFLFSITGYLGMLAIAPKLENAYVNQHVCLCRPKSNFNKKYLGYWIISKSGGHHYLNKNQKGAVKAGLNLGDLKTFPVPLCQIEEQDKIVQAIESRLSVADKMKENINQSLQQAEALRQSILKKAFEGRLIAL